MLSGHEIALALRSAYLSMHRQADAYFVAHGVTADQFVLLSALAEEDAVTRPERRSCSHAGCSSSAPLASS